MSKFDTFLDWFFPAVVVCFILAVPIIVIGSIGYHNERYNMTELNSDREYFFTTKQVEGHNILIVSNRYDDKSFEVIDLGESTVKAEK
jgi:hypothetical protein